MRSRCPTCEQSLDVPEELSGPTGTCPRCGGRVRWPERAAAREAVAAEIDRPGRGRLGPRDEDDPRRDRFDVTLPARPAALWPRFISPSMMALALLTFPLPWVEVRCANANVQSTYSYSQTGTQMLADRHTDLPSGQVGVAPQVARPARQVAAILLALALFAGVIVGLIPGLGWRIAHLCCAALACALMPALLLVILFGEVFNSVTFTPWVAVATLACAGGLILSIVVFVSQGASGRGRPPREWGDDG